MMKKGMVTKIAGSIVKAKFPPKAMDFNKVKDPDAFWKYNVEEAAKNNALRPFGSGYPKEIGDVIFWLNQVAANWNDGIGKPKKAAKELDKDGLLYAIVQHVSSGTIANYTGLKKYKDIDGVINAAVQILQRDGDKEYSLKNLKEVLLEAKDEYLENKQRERSKD